jgi:hypothetical protein
MNPAEIAQIISREIDRRLGSYIDNQYLRGIVESIQDVSHVNVYVDGSLNVTGNLPVIKGLVPKVGEKVLILNMGRSGANLLVVASLETTEAWKTPSMTGGWLSYDTDPGGWSAPGYYKDYAGTVHLRGLIRAGTIGSAAFTLPAGYRPTGGDLLIGTISNGGVGRVKVNTAGGVIPESPSVNTWVALDGISFRGDV